MSKYITFTRDDVLHAALGVIPAFLLVATGHLTLGAAFAIGLLPTSLLGISPKRRTRIIYGIVGCLFGVGILVGSIIFNRNNVLETALLFIIISYIASVVASKKPVGGLLLSILLPSLAVGTGYEVPRAFALMLAFMAGSIWSSLVSLPWPEFTPDKNMRTKLLALQPNHPRTYGLLLGATAASAILIGHLLDLPYPGWIATAAMLIMRPLQQMTGWRGVGRAISTIAGTLLVILTIQMGLGYFATAVLVAVIAIVTIGAKASLLYITPFGTAFLILTIELYGATDSLSIQNIGRYRIINNVLGALIAIVFGQIISGLLDGMYKRRLKRS